MVKFKRAHTIRVSEEIPVYPMGEIDTPGFVIRPFKYLNVSYSGSLRNGFPPHRHPNFEVFWVQEGHAEGVVDSRPFTIGPMSLFFTSPGEVHNFSRAEHLSGMLMQFSPAFIATLDAVLPEPLAPPFWRPLTMPVLSLQPDEQVPVGRIFENLYEDAIKPGPQKVGCVLAHLLLLFNRVRYYYQQRVAGASEPAESLLTRRFQTALRASCPPMVTVKQFADSLGVSRSFLHRTITRETGHSPSELIHERLMVEAKRQLLHTNSDLAVIANRLGFGDASYFGRFFNRHASMSPNRFRRHHCLIGPV